VRTSTPTKINQSTLSKCKCKLLIIISDDEGIPCGWKVRGSFPDRNTTGAQTDTPASSAAQWVPEVLTTVIKTVRA
jgi:hypothetical protein